MELIELYDELGQKQGQHLAKRKYTKLLLNER